MLKKWTVPKFCWLPSLATVSWWQAKKIRATEKDLPGWPDFYTGLRIEVRGRTTDRRAGTIFAQVGLPGRAGRAGRSGRAGPAGRFKSTVIVFDFPGLGVKIRPWCKREKSCDFSRRFQRYQTTYVFVKKISNVFSAAVKNSSKSQW